ncbi:right-handed parallel beta-helix repeat-containing protein [Agrilutibacter solisilvae]|uniref:Right-handed parallel beta-helix repeat-containing protein n=1 Tax=Agrilutibacter solisilvae TaxID=2763317 RepID=A0A974XVY3_9GAMM|nr:right-handed parallel beta-helix repeat-containing protein [Lysobacter solisilvae]QSX76919.1 right-handed parallel beta-helix repeat-containing protein [Lysobacter solisilvae]
MARPLFLLLAVAAVATCMLPGAARAARAYDNCTGYIDAVPAAIATQGTWCLRKDVSTAVANGAAIEVKTNNVIIDCNDFKIGGLGAGTGTSTFGIYAAARVNVTVRNCSLRGFRYGVALLGAAGSGHVVENNRLQGNTQAGVVVEGDGSSVRNNLVTDTGGSTLYTGSAAGVRTLGAVHVQDNIVSGVAPSADADGHAGAIGIHSLANDNGALQRNRVRGLLPVGAGTAVGVRIEGDTTLVLEGNDVIGPASGTGLLCDAGTVLATGNAVLGFATAIDTCVDVGGNVVDAE